jgi:hypothetical protein
LFERPFRHIRREGFLYWRLAADGFWLLATGCSLLANGYSLMADGC